MAIYKHIVVARKSEKTLPEPAQAKPHDRAQDEGFPSVVEYPHLKPALCSAAKRPVFRSANAQHDDPHRGLLQTGDRRPHCRVCVPRAGHHRPPRRLPFGFVDCGFRERRIDVKWEDEAINTTARYRVTTKKSFDIFSEIESTVRKCSGRLKEGKLGERGDGTSPAFSFSKSTRAKI